MHNTARGRSLKQLGQPDTWTESTGHAAEHLARPRGISTNRKGHSLPSRQTSHVQANPTQAESRVWGLLVRVPRPFRPYTSQTKKHHEPCAKVSSQDFVAAKDLAPCKSVWVPTVNWAWQVLPAQVKIIQVCFLGEESDSHDTFAPRNLASLDLINTLTIGSLREIRSQNRMHSLSDEPRFVCRIDWSTLSPRSCAVSTLAAAPRLAHWRIGQGAAFGRRGKRIGA